MLSGANEVRSSGTPPLTPLKPQPPTLSPDPLYSPLTKEEAGSLSAAGRGGATTQVPQLLVSPRDAREEGNCQGLDPSPDQEPLLPQQPVYDAPEPNETRAGAGQTGEAGQGDTSPKACGREAAKDAHGDGAPKPLHMAWDVEEAPDLDTSDGGGGGATGSSSSGDDSGRGSGGGGDGNGNIPGSGQGGVEDGGAQGGVNGGHGDGSKGTGIGEVSRGEEADKTQRQVEAGQGADGQVEKGDGKTPPPLNSAPMCHTLYPRQSTPPPLAHIKVPSILRKSRLIGSSTSLRFASSRGFRSDDDNGKEGVEEAPRSMIKWDRPDSSRVTGFDEEEDPGAEWEAGA